jgi:flagellar biosynthetic protein FliS
MSSKGADQYRQNSHQVASKEQLVLFVFEKAITVMWEARATIEAGEKVEAVKSLHLARRLFMELQASLDEEGGEMSGNLHHLYTYIIREISRAGFEGDPQILENAIAIAEQLYEGFFEAFSVGDPSEP